MPKKKQAAPVQTFAQAQDWIKRNAKHTGSYHKTVREATFWFFANREADGFQDFTTRDFASLVLSGLPKLTVADIDDQLREAVEEGGEDYELATPFDLTPELRDFWGVK